MAEAMWNGSGYVVVTVGSSPMCCVAGATSDATSDGVEAPAHLVGAVVDPPQRAGLDAERVVEGDEVEQAPLGRAGLVDPVPGREQLGRAGRRVAPRRRVPAGAVEADGEVDVAVVGGGHRGAAADTRAPRSAGSSQPSRPASGRGNDSNRVVERNAGMA